jgi:hypothetical protein
MRGTDSIRTRPKLRMNLKEFFTPPSRGIYLLGCETNMKAFIGYMNQCGRCVWLQQRRNLFHCNRRNAFLSVCFQPKKCRFYQEVAFDVPFIVVAAPELVGYAPQAERKQNLK